MMRHTNKVPEHVAAAQVQYSSSSYFSLMNFATQLGPFLQVALPQ